MDRGAIQQANREVDDGWNNTVGYRRRGNVEVEREQEEEERRVWNTQKARKQPEQLVSKPILCSVKPINTSQAQTATPRTAGLGFFLPNRNIFVPCSSKEQYFFIKKKIMEKKAKNRSKSKGFCYTGAHKKYNTLQNCSVRDGDDELYDMNSCELEKVEYYE